MANDDLETDQEAVKATAELARSWAKWLAFDLQHFIDPVAEATGLPRDQVLLYLVSERLSQIAEHGITIKLVARHDIVQHPPEDEGDDWKNDGK